MQSEPTLEDRIITLIIVGFWTLLIVFGLVSMTQPDWLKAISDPGKHSEAMDMKHLADDYLKQGNYPQAIKVYKMVLEIEPDLQAAAGNLAIAYARQGQHHEALRVFRYNLQQEPDNPATIYRNMAEVYEKMNDPANALALYTLCAQTDPLPAYPLAKQGSYLLRAGRFQEALDAFQQSLDASADLQQFYQGSLLEERVGFKEGSPEREVLETYLASGIDSQDLMVFDTTVFRWKLKHDRELAKTYHFMGIAHTQLRDLHPALSHFEQALKIWPGFRDARKNLEAVRTAIEAEQQAEFEKISLPPG